MVVTAVAEVRGVAEEQPRMTAKVFGLDRRVQGWPEDLRQGTGESALAKLALDAARAVAAERLNLSGKGETDSTPQQLLALLTYCYAACIYGSQDVELACRNDPVVCSLCPKALPDWRAIWRFRNANRPWIEEGLARVYFAASGGAAPPDSSGETTRDIATLVRRKLRHAVWTDAAMFD